MNAFASGSMLLSVTAAAKSCVTLHGSIPNLNMHACRECSPLLMVRSDRSDYFITLCVQQGTKGEIRIVIIIIIK